MKYQAGDSVSGPLRRSLEEYEQQRGAAWSEAMGQHRYLRFVDQLAVSLMEGAEHLAPTTLVVKGVPFRWEQLRALAEALDPSGKPALRPLVRERIELELIQRHLDEVPRMTERALELTQLVMEENASERVIRFLQRLSRTYISGFFSESIILCRSVLENALIDSFERKKVPFPQDQQGRSTMKSRLKAAERLGLLSPNAAKDAWTIWTRGNVAVHHDPEAAKDARGTLRLTVRVLKELYA